MGSWIDRNGMCVRRPVLPHRGQRPSTIDELLLEDRDGSRFTPNVQATERGIECKHVGILRRSKRRGGSHRAKVDDKELRISFARHERETVGLIDEKSMRMVARHWVPC